MMLYCFWHVKRAIGTNPLTAHGAAVDSYLEPPARYP